MTRVLLVAAASVLLLHSALAVVSKAAANNVDPSWYLMFQVSHPILLTWITLLVYSKLSLLCLNCVRVSIQDTTNAFSSHRWDRLEIEGTHLIQWAR